MSKLCALVIKPSSGVTHMFADSSYEALPAINANIPFSMQSGSASTYIQWQHAATWTAYDI